MNDCMNDCVFGKMIVHIGKMKFLEKAKTNILWKNERKK